MLFFLNSFNVVIRTGQKYSIVLPVLLQGEIMDNERLRQLSNFFFDKRHRKRVVFT